MTTVHHPSALRNRVPICEVLEKQLLKSSGTALEIASGTGCHLELFAERFPNFTWQPTEYLVDPNLEASDIGRIGTRSLDILETIDAVGSSQFSNVNPAVGLDVSQTFPEYILSQKFDLVVLVNVLHISPIECTHGLMIGAGAVLKDEALLCVYGPFKKDGNFTGDGGNERFDVSLKERNSLWGIRDVEYVEEYAKNGGLELLERIDMPANNFLLLFRKTSAAPAAGVVKLADL